jgi:hypothetical protein
VKSIQLRMEYDLHPPLTGGHPFRSKQAILAEVQLFYDKAPAKVLAAFAKQSGQF